MKTENLDVFARALLFLRKERLASVGLKAELKAVRVEKPKK